MGVAQAQRTWECQHLQQHDLYNLQHGHVILYRGSAPRLGDPCGKPRLVSPALCNTRCGDPGASTHTQLLCTYFRAWFCLQNNGVMDVFIPKLLTRLGSLESVRIACDPSNVFIPKLEMFVVDEPTYWQVGDLW